MIQTVVDWGGAVSTDLASSGCQGTRHGCISGSTLFVEGSLQPGAIATTIAHEAGHITLGITPSNALSFADNEIGAWDLARPAYNGLQGVSPYGGQARAEFGNVMTGLADPQIRQQIWLDLAAAFIRRNR